MRYQFRFATISKILCIFCIVCFAKSTNLFAGSNGVVLVDSQRNISLIYFDEGSAFSDDQIIFYACGRELVVESQEDCLVKGRELAKLSIAEFESATTLALKTVSQNSRQDEELDPATTHQIRTLFDSLKGKNDEKIAIDIAKIEQKIADKKKYISWAAQEEQRILNDELSELEDEHKILLAKNSDYIESKNNIVNLKKSLLLDIKSQSITNPIFSSNQAKQIEYLIFSALVENSPTYGNGTTNTQVSSNVCDKDLDSEEDGIICDPENYVSSMEAPEDQSWNNSRGRDIEYNEDGEVIRKQRSYYRSRNYSADDYKHGAAVLISCLLLLC